uniref:Uncharacterized protein n=1 Tax=Amphimedon queenslandica TaxID=400682 RepID=A0A1X7VS71_AMPQE
DSCFACSPDGLVDYIDTDGHQHSGLVKYNCPFTLADQKLSPIEGCSNSVFCSNLFDNTTILKTSYPYYHQVQGDMEITGRQWCDFVIWTPSRMSV